MFLVALLPPLWYRVMDPLLLEQVERDPARIHFYPKRKADLCERYGLAESEPSDLSSLIDEDGRPQENAA
jgi:hypothetical protein